MKTSQVWDILVKFKHFCKCQGWRTSESEDWVEMGNSYHNFLWTREVSPESFKKIITNRKCVVRNGLSYHVVESEYTAWLFSETPPECLVKTVSENPELCKRTALYDMSQITHGKSICVKLNNTESTVFQEFENFLQSKYEVKVVPIPFLTDQGAENDTYTAATLA